VNKVLCIIFAAITDI